MDINNITLVGRLTKDVELKQTNSGKMVASFTLATNKDRETVYFIDCVAWNKTAELLAQYTSKGNRVGVTGMLTNRTYENQQGQKVKVTEILVNNISFLESKNDSQPQKVQADTSSRGSYKQATQATYDDSLPF